MSRKTTQTPATVAQSTTAGGAVVYCGPSVKGVAKQFTVYTGELPPALRQLMEQHPEAKALTVHVSRFALMWKNLNTPGTTEAILYRKLEQKLN